MYNNVLCLLKNTCKTYGNKNVFISGDQKMTFCELDKISDSVASFVSKYISKNTPVAVMSSRCVYTPAIFIGVVKAGGFYAPMDASMPLSRLGSMLDVVKPSVLITDRQNEKIAKELDFDGQIFVYEDIVNTPCDRELLDGISQNIIATDPLYLIFTSGSTGVPKGVVTSHLSLMNYIDAVCKVLDITDEDVLGNQSPLDYIAAIRDIYIPIKTGATTVIIPKNEFAMPTDLFETLNKNQITTICWSTAGIELPAKLGIFSELQPKYIRKVCFSGSVMPCKYLKIWRQYLPDALFVNQYGPTEATASCTYYVVNEPVEDDTVLPIGKAYDGYKILLLDENGNQTANGEIGEICVGGVGVTLGYYGDKQRTEQSFVQNPLNKDFRDIIYKTGDLGRFDENGILHFHGRRDRQIKYMGHRVELGEIEISALAVAGVGECTALYNDIKEQIWFFYTGNATSKEIVLHLRQVLPSFMAPRKLVNLEKMPKLPNGKTDIQTLKSYFA